MNGPAAIDHRHTPLYRVVQRSWADPVDASFSRLRTGNRWNTTGFPALYCCCSEPVARAITLDIFRMAGVELSDLRVPARPQLAEMAWQGPVADVVSAEGIAAAGFPAEYPAGVDKSETRRWASEWHAAGYEGVVCRSASLARQGFRNWQGDHERSSEVAIFVENSATAPVLLRRREDMEWFLRSRTA